MNNTYQILVVDDDFSIVNIIETALKQAGYGSIVSYRRAHFKPPLVLTLTYLITKGEMLGG